MKWGISVLLSKNFEAIVKKISNKWCARLCLVCNKCWQGQTPGSWATLQRPQPPSSKTEPDLPHCHWFRRTPQEGYLVLIKLKKKQRKDWKQTPSRGRISSFDQIESRKNDDGSICLKYSKTNPCQGLLQVRCSPPERKIKSSLKLQILPLKQSTNKNLRWSTYETITNKSLLGDELLVVAASSPCGDPLPSQPQCQQDLAWEDYFTSWNWWDFKAIEQVEMACWCISIKRKWKKIKYRMMSSRGCMYEVGSKKDDW